MYLHFKSVNRAWFDEVQREPFISFMLFPLMLFEKNGCASTYYRQVGLLYSPYLIG